MSILRSAEHRTYALAGVLAAVAALACLGIPGSPVVSHAGPRWVIDVCLVAGFVIGEQLLMNVEFHKQAHSITLSGIPLALGVMIAPIGDVVVARVVGAGLALMLQRISLEKIVYNSAAYAFEAAADCAVLHAIIGSTAGLTVGRGMAVTAVVVLSDQLMSALVLVVIRIHGGALSRSDVTDVFALEALFALVSSTTA